VYQDKRDVSGGKNATANFVWKCGSCKRESSAKFDPSPPQPYKAENGQFAPLVKIECRGLEFIGFEPRNVKEFLTIVLMHIALTFVPGDLEMCWC
jgi:hypothetical protein